MALSSSARRAVDGFFRRLGHGGALGPLFNHLPDVYLFAKGRNHRFVMANRALWKLHGCSSEEEMLGRTDADFHPPQLARQYVEEDDRVMATGQPLVDQVWLVRGADRVPRWYLSTKIPLRDRRRKIVGVAGVLRPYGGAGEAPDGYSRLTPAVDHVLKRFDEPLAVAALARLTHLSVSQFQREFQRLFAMSPKAYVLQVRLQAARRMLEETRQTLGQIALQCGFCDQSHFAKRFKAVTGMGPLSYRKRFGAHTAGG